MEKLIVLILALVIAYNAHAQEIKKHYDENKMVSKVDFYSNGELKNTISLENPFNVTSYDSIVEQKGAIVYHISGDDLSKLGDVFFQELSLDSKIIEVSEIGLLAYRSRVFQMRDGYYMIIHTLDAIDQYNQYCATSATGKLYDSEGNFMIKIKPSNKGITRPIVTKNGKYLIFNIHYEVLREGFGWWSNTPAFDIYNIENEELIYTHILPKNAFNYNYPMTYHDYVVVRTVVEKDKMKFFVLFPEEMVSYTNYYTKKEGYSIKSFDKDGIVFKTEDGRERKDVFEDDFTKTVFPKK